MEFTKKDLLLTDFKETAGNSVLAKDGVNIVFENSVNNIRKNAFHISFLRNLEI